MQFTLDLDMSNDAFQSYENDIRDATEVAAILRTLADRLDDANILAAYISAGTLRDSNGNPVGAWEVKL